MNKRANFNWVSFFILTKIVCHRLCEYFINDSTILTVYIYYKVFLIDCRIKICIYFIMFDLIVTALVRRQKVKVKEYKTRYDSVYDSLLYLKNQPIPQTKYRISTNKHTLSSLLSYQFIKPVTNKNLILYSEYTDVPHYVISPKGIEYIKRYESLKQLF
jgi:hypothetical protein